MELLFFTQHLYSPFYTQLPSSQVASIRISECTNIPYIKTSFCFTTFLYDFVFSSMQEFFQSSRWNFGALQVLFYVWMNNRGNLPLILVCVRQIKRMDALFQIYLLHSRCFGHEVKIINYTISEHHNRSCNSCGFVNFFKGYLLLPNYRMWMLNYEVQVFVGGLFIHVM